MTPEVCDLRAPVPGRVVESGGHNHYRTPTKDRSGARSTWSIEPGRLRPARLSSPVPRCAAVLWSSVWYNKIAASWWVLHLSEQYIPLQSHLIASSSIPCLLQSQSRSDRRPSPRTSRPNRQRTFLLQSSRSSMPKAFTITRQRLLTPLSRPLEAIPI